MRKILFTLPLLLLVMLFSRCNINEDLKTLQSAIDSLQIVIGTPEFNTLVKVEFIDATTNRYVSGKTINARVLGKNANDVYSNLGTKETSYTTSHGLLMLVIDPKAVDSVAIKTAPIEFDLAVTADGYLSTTQRVMLYEAKLNTVTIKLTNLTNAPQGVSVSVNNSFAVAGVTGQTVAPAIQTMNLGKQTVTVPAGVVLKDASGNPVTGTVKSEIVYYDPVSESAQNAFPGGTNVSATLPDGSEGQIEFISAGMFSVNLTAGGKEVKTFENGGIKLRTVVPPTLINPNTGLPIKVGDRIEMWSKEIESGEWVYEKMATVKLENGELVLEETVTHLSFWNWDFFYNSCTLGTKFIFKGNLTGHYPYVKVTSRIANTTFDKIGYTHIGDGFLQLYNTPSNVAATFKFEDAGWDASRTLTFSPATLNVANLCSGQIIEITVTENIPSPPEQITVKLDLAATSATNAQFIIRPNAYVYFKTSTARNWSYFYLWNGKATVDFELGETYEILGYFGNNYGMGTLKIDKLGTSQLRVTMTPTINFSTGNQSATISFDVNRPENNIVDIKYNAVLPDNLMNQLR